MWQNHTRADYSPSDRPNGGDHRFEGEDISNPSKKDLKRLREEMQIIFQDPYSSLNPRLSVSEAIMEPLLIQAKMSKDEAREEVLKLMKIVGQDEAYENAYPHELDGGRRQRIVIARALALKPKFIVCE
jgi:peptide/nickel transport system ATP-binding protein